MVVATIRVLVPPKKRNELLQTLHSLSESIRSQPGCLSYRFYSEIGNDADLCVVEEWASRAEFDEHVRSRDFAVLFGAVNTLHGSEAFEFNLLVSVGGLEVINEVRTTTKVHQLFLI